MLMTNPNLRCDWSTLGSTNSFNSIYLGGFLDVRFVKEEVIELEFEADDRMNG